MRSKNEDREIEQNSYQGITFPEYLTGGVRDDVPLWCEHYTSPIKQSERPVTKSEGQTSC